MAITRYMRPRYQYTKTLFCPCQSIVVEFSRQRPTPAVNFIKLLQVQLSFSDSKTMASLVNYTCKSFINLTPVQDGFQIMIRYDPYYPSNCQTLSGHLLLGLEPTCGNQAQDRSVYLGSRCRGDCHVSFSDHGNHVKPVLQIGTFQVGSTSLQ